MTKKNKIITTFISLLAIIVLLVVLSSTLFAVSEVKVSFQTPPQNGLTSVSETEIVQSANIKLGTNVFLLEKKKATQNLEKANPYIKVINIETKFPNKVIIHAAERDEVLAFQKDDKCYITDCDFKVLRIVNGEYTSDNSNAIKILFDGEGASEGEFLNVSDKFKPLKTLEEANYQNFSKEESANALITLLATYKSISVLEDKIELQTFLGVKVTIYSPGFKQQEKLKMITIIMDSLTDEQKHLGTITISQSDGKVVGSYRADE